MRAATYSKGFTLIELSIVLVIIGLVTGGILFGRDMIKAAAVRSQVSQLERYDAAINTFRVKYNGLPGDLSPNKAASFGFATRDGAMACGNDNRYIESFYVSDGGCSIDANDEAQIGFCTGPSDESTLLFNDLYRANLIAESVTQSFITQRVELIFPEAKLGVNAFIVAANGDINKDCISRPMFGYYFISYTKGAVLDGNTPSAALTSEEAFAIDTKMDDGNAIRGRIYTLNQVPGFGTNANIGTNGTCANAVSGIYSLSNTNPNICVLRVRSGAN